VILCLQGRVFQPAFFSGIACLLSKSFGYSTKDVPNDKAVSAVWNGAPGGIRKAILKPFQPFKAILVVFC
jgi:hypothetical protein